jgi:hypothetical protein
MLMLMLGVMRMLRLLWWSRRQSFLEHFAYSGEIGVTPPNGIAAGGSWFVWSAKSITISVSVCVSGSETTGIGVDVDVSVVRAISTIGFARAG